MIVSIILILLIFFILLGVPISISLGITSLISIFLLPGSPMVYLNLVAKQMFSGVNSFLLVAVPFFMLAGQIMNRSGVTKRLFAFADACVGRLPGGLGHVNILSSLIFAGMSGSAAADVAGLGSIEIEAMNKRGFPLPFTVGLTAASSTVGPMVPPSIPMIIFGVVSGTSIGGLFLAGIFPGLIICSTLGVMVLVLGIKNNYPREKDITFNQIVKSFIEAIPALLTPVIVLSGIFGGVFTPTEASLVAVVYTLFLGIVIYREVSIKETIQIIKDVAREIAPLMLIVASASLFGQIIIRLGIPQQLTHMILSVTQNPIMVLFLIVFILLLIGFFMETISAIIIFTPLFLPLTNALGISPFQLGVLMVMTLMVGVVTPPVGIVLFILQKISSLKLEQVFRAVLPFFIPLLITIVILVMIPELSLYLPKFISSG